MDDELYEDEDNDEEAAEELADFLRDAVAEALRTEDAAVFMEWVREEAPERAPQLFEDLPSEEARRGITTELGRTLWNAIPLPGNGYRPRPLERPERNDPCPCGSGAKYKKCCGEWAGAVPSFDPELIWAIVVESLPLEKVEELGEAGRIPRNFVGDLATSILDNGDAERAVAMVRPMFDRPERLDERDGAALNALLEAHDALELFEEKQELVDRLSRQLRPLLRAVLWEHLVRWHAVEGEMEEAWEALENARKDDPESSALGPLEVSLLLAEGRTEEAGERARFFRERFRRDPGEMTEAGLEFLDKVAQDPEDAQLEFSIGKEVKAEIRELQDWLADAKPPAIVYDVEAIEDDPGAGRLSAPESLDEVDTGWEEAFFQGSPKSFLGEDGEDEYDEEEDFDPWEEERAERWLGYLLDNEEALDSLETLEDLGHAFHDLVVDRYPYLDRPILRPLLDRALTILRQSLAARPDITRLPGDFEPNGSALELISLAAAQASRMNELERVRELVDWMTALDPQMAEE